MTFVDAPHSSSLDSLTAPGPLGPLAVLVLVLGFLAWRVVRQLRRRRGLRACRWKRDGSRAGMRRWHCAVCGVDAFGTGRRPPKECKRALKPGGL